MKIDCGLAADVERIVGIPSQSPHDQPWTISFHEADDAPSIPFIDQFISVLSGKTQQLKRLNSELGVITLWVLYEYDQECNLEFSAGEMEKLARNDISLCISCWQKEVKRLNPETDAAQ